MNRSVRMILAIVLLLGGCGPAVQRFEVRPRRVCSGQQVVVSWRARWRVRLTRTQPSATWAGLPRRGQRQFVVNESTRFTLRAIRNGKPTGNAGVGDVTVMPGGGPHAFLWTTAPDGERKLVAVGVLKGTKWAPELKVGKVRNDADRPLILVHDGRTVVLGKPGAVSSGLAGTPFAGRWLVHADLKPGERMGDPAHPPPARLRVTLFSRCGG